MRTKRKPKEEATQAVLASLKLEQKTIDDLQSENTQALADLKVADEHLVQCRAAFAEAEQKRKLAREEYVRAQGPDTRKVWREAVTFSKTAEEACADARDKCYRLQALTTALAAEIRNRRGTLQPTTTNTAQSADTAAGIAPQKKKRKHGVTANDDCPFCGHHYTVRDGLSDRVDEAGNRLQLRKCQCREKTPPCKNCPKCRADVEVMSAKGEAQGQLCRSKLNCEICACTCPASGKWIEGDEISRQKFKARTEKRHTALSQLLQTDWTDATGEASATIDDKSGNVPQLKRLPADIVDELEAVAAAKSLAMVLGSMGEEEGHSDTEGASGQLGAIPEQHTHNSQQEQHHQGGGAVSEDSEGHCEECGEVGHHSHHHSHHHHVHKCTHPHEDCTSACCSAA